MAAKHSVKIKACECRHEFQDQTYGKQQRVHNVTHHTGKTDKIISRCTVCGKEEIK